MGSTNQNLSLNKLEAFKDLSKEEINELEEKSKIVNYSIGQIIANQSIIQDPTLIILKGEARLLGKDQDNQFTIAKIGIGNFIGLASLLRIDGCENMICSTELKALAIPNQLLLEFYKI